MLRLDGNGPAVLPAQGKKCPCHPCQPQDEDAKTYSSYRLPAPNNSPSMPVAVRRDPEDHQPHQSRHGWHYILAENAFRLDASSPGWVVPVLLEHKP